MFNTGMTLMTIVVAFLYGGPIGDKPLGQLKTYIQQGRVESLEVYLMDWSKLTRESITPSQLEKKYDIHTLVRSPRFSDSTVQSIMDQANISAGSPDIRLGAVFHMKDGHLVKVFFGHSTELMIVNGLVMPLDRSILDLLLVYLPCTSVQEIRAFFQKG